eukprot:TRINITY_DN14062_c0_g1_i1.p1 TRINITY_DN14062_c0_g1~~TRINITY_DN14062_c0_g1_i1.p1  ORF type:complete len:104 (+),score=14.37 TRINITY_DN14062_c0_g1_i1:35-346(+)
MARALQELEQPPVLGGGARPVMCYPDPKQGPGPNGAEPFRCFGMALLQDAREAVQGMKLPTATQPIPFGAEPLNMGCLPMVFAPCRRSIRTIDRQRLRYREFL